MTQPKVKKHAGRPPEFSVPRRQFNKLVPLPIFDKVLAYVNRESLPYRIKKTKVCKN